MVQISVADQLRIIHDPDIKDSARVSVMPLLIVLNNGIIGEAKSIRGAIAIATNNEYLDLEDAELDWHFRVENARREAMIALGMGIDAVVYDSRIGIIKNNYAADPNDPDYLDDPDEPIGIPEKIMVDNDRRFLLSLARIGAIRILERNDSYILRPHPEWDLIHNGGKKQSCGSCIHRIQDEKEGLICPVYNMLVKETDGTKCMSYTIPESSQKEYTGGEYIDIAMEYGVDELMQKVGQEWILEEEK